MVKEAHMNLKTLNIYKITFVRKTKPVLYIKNKYGKTELNRLYFLPNLKKGYIFGSLGINFMSIVRFQISCILFLNIYIKFI